MKKSFKRVGLSRETVRKLGVASLRRAAGGLTIHACTDLCGDGGGGPTDGCTDNTCACPTSDCSYQTSGACPTRGNTGAM